MSLNERDYMRRPAARSPPPGSWWQKINLQAALAIALSVFAVGSAAVWFLRNVSDYSASIARPVDRCGTAL